MRVLLTILSAGLMLSVSPARTGAPMPSDMRVSVAIDNAAVVNWGPGFVAGIRRAFQQDSVLLERAGLTAGRADFGRIPNRIRLVPRPGYFQTADRGWFRRVTPDSSRAIDAEPDSIVLIRLGTMGEVNVDYAFPERASDRKSEPPEKPDVLLQTTCVATCAPGRLADSLEWTNLRVQWAERAETPARSQEIRGWMVGMAAMQLLYQREQWLPDSVELVFESRGRNR